MCRNFFGGFLIGFIILLSLVLYFQQLTKDASSISDRELKAKILHIPGDELINHNNQILEEYDHSQNTLIVGPNHVNSNIIHALTASEDTLFYKHNGIMPKALLRAMLQDITNSNQSSGGSTITQQLVKNQVLSNKKLIVVKQMKLSWLHGSKIYYQKMKSYIRI